MTRQQIKPPVTQRAYTLRLRGADPSDRSWRDALWRTHEAVNKGAKVFGDWLLTLRGGLDHSLADTEGKNGKGKPSQPSSEERKARKARRILLALSWLSVESERGAPSDLVIASGKDAPAKRNSKVIAAFEEILKVRGVVPPEIDDWKNDCSASLNAAIREDAVWVNRSKAFDERIKSADHSLTREEVWDMLDHFFGSREAYLKPSKDPGDVSSGEQQEEKAKELVQSAGQWLSSRFGTGRGADFCRMAGVYNKIASWAGTASPGTGKAVITSLSNALRKYNPVTNDLPGVFKLISGPGYKSATRNLLKKLNSKNDLTEQDLLSLKEKATSDTQKCRQREGMKGKRPYADAILKEVESACGFTYLQHEGRARHREFAVMLDHAARRVSLAHTWIKNAEAERRLFEKNAMQIDQIPAGVKKWLDEFCQERSRTTGALEPYRIRRRAVAGWEELIGIWSKNTCRTSSDRISAARALQDDPEMNKFGDIQLFEALAEDDAQCVWHKEGDVTKDPDHKLLIAYASATEVEFKKRQFKVPAYRHPDSLLHPIFCDFGNSRWDICFDIHKDLQTLHPKKLSLSLWTGSKLEPVDLFWQSKRLTRDLALQQNGKEGQRSKLTRADRMGRAASNVDKDDAVEIEGLFEQKDWNGRLQAPRQQLDSIAARVGKHGWDAQSKRMRENLRWLITFSAKFQPRGPWCEYTEKNELRGDPRYGPNADQNRHRKDHPRLILFRLPGLRVLSVDLGHRYAAACAVWETLDAEKVVEACRTAGHAKPKESDLYLHLKRKVKKQRKGKEIEVEETTIYRRLGADKLPNSTPHPAPWARMDRQFLIRLQGEKEGTRLASDEEIWKVHQLEAELGRTTPIVDRLAKAGWGQFGGSKNRLGVMRELGWRPAKEVEPSDGTDSEEGGKPSLNVDELMSCAVRAMRLALKRHGDRARIAHYLVAHERIKPGGIKEIVDEHGRIELLQDALALWHGMFSTPGWRDEAARRLWDDHIAKLPGYKALEVSDEGSSGVERKKGQKENWEKLRALAESLARDETLRKNFHDVWAQQWENEDQRWKKRLRWFKDWIVPRGKAANSPSIRKVGGLSLTRLGTLTEFRRKVQVGFFTRLRPDGTRAETGERFGQRVLDALERLREQRVKQLASRIAEAALGIGSENRHHWDKGKRPIRRIEDPRYAPCHAVIIENLTHYRPEEKRTRRENRQLMTWSSSRVRKYLSEACQLNGLHLREVSASYTSRQDSRTGAPGLRCTDVPLKEFMRSPFWRKQVKQAEAKQADKKGDARERFLCDLNTKWKNKVVADWEKAGVVRIPLKGGEVFVSADGNSPAAKGLQADLNAAANIGLKALMDPDWPGRWWYVPCEAGTFKPVRDKVEGSAAVDLKDTLKKQPQQLGSVVAMGEKKRGGKSDDRSKEIVNLWRDVSSNKLDSDHWKEYSAYWNEVQDRVIENLRRDRSLARVTATEPLSGNPF